MEKRIEELIELEKEMEDSLILVVPSALILCGIIILIGAIAGKAEHSIVSYSLGIVGLFMLSCSIKIRKRKKKRIKELRKELL